LVPGPTATRDRRMPRRRSQGIRPPSSRRAEPTGAAGLPSATNKRGRSSHTIRGTTAGLRAVPARHVPLADGSLSWSDQTFFCCARGGVLHRDTDNAAVPRHRRTARVRRAAPSPAVIRRTGPRATNVGADATMDRLAAESSENKHSGKGHRRTSGVNLTFTTHFAAD
jgi:hypothetical protein